MKLFSSDLLLWFVSGLVLQLWFWYGFSYDFDMTWVNIVILISVKRVKITRKHIRIKSESHQNRPKIASKPHQNHIKIISKSYQNHKNPWEIDQKPVPGLLFFPFLQPTHRNPKKEAPVLKPNQNQMRIMSKSYQTRIKTVSKPYQNHIKTTKTREKSTKSLSWGCFCFLSQNQPIGNPEKGAPFPNHIKTISKSCPKPYLSHNPNHIKHITKLYGNHNPKFKTYQNHIKLKAVNLAA